MASLNIPNSFTNGTVANATQVNDNFTAVKNFVETSLVQTDGSIQLPDSSVTSAKIVDGTIVNADISASAGISFSKMSDRTAWANHSFTSFNSGPTVDLASNRTQFRYKVIDKTCFVKGVLYATHSSDMVTQLNGLPVAASVGTAGLWSAGTAFVKDVGGSTFVQYPIWVDGSNNRFNLVFTSAAFTGVDVRWYYDLVYEIA